jgi:hypothetical protein
VPEVLLRHPQTLTPVNLYQKKILTSPNQQTMVEALRQWKTTIHLRLSRLTLKKSKNNRSKNKQQLKRKRKKQGKQLLPRQLKLSTLQKKAE